MKQFLKAWLQTAPIHGENMRAAKEANVRLKTKDDAYRKCKRAGPKAWVQVYNIKQWDWGQKTSE